MDSQKLHDYHTHTLFFLFVFVALLGLSVLLLRGWFQDVTGAVTATAEYTSCVDYGNYIILSNNAGWKQVKKDVCTGAHSQYIRKAACVLREEPKHPVYTYVYSKLASCTSSTGVSSSCTLDSNKAAYCPE